MIQLMETPAEPNYLLIVYEGGQELGDDTVNAFVGRGLLPSKSTTDMKPTDKKVVWEGPMEIWEQEGGYADSALTIGDDKPVEQIEQAFEDTVRREYGDSLMKVPGQWRLTLERIK